MKRHVSFCVLAAGLAASATVAAAPASSQTESPEQQVRAFEAEVFAAYNADDAARAAGHYAEDAFVFIPNLPPARGRAAVAANIRMFMADPHFKLGYQNQLVRVSGDGTMAYTRGRLEVTYTDPKTKAAQSTSSHYLLILRKDAKSGWQVMEDVSF